jgi:hypothetical protein
MKTADWQSNAIIDLSKLVEDIVLDNMVVILARDLLSYLVLRHISYSPEKLDGKNREGD